MSTRSKPLSKAELRNALAHAQTKPTQSTEELVSLLGLKSVKTIYLWRAAGRLDGCFRKRGKHLVFLTERTLDAFFNGPEWKA